VVLVLRLGAGQGAFGESPELMRSGLEAGVDYLVCDSLAETTSAFFALDRRHDEAAGFAPDLLSRVGIALPGIADRTSRLAPVSPAVARTMLGETRVLTALVEADIDPSAVVDVIVQVAQLASDQPRVRDLDLNPVIASSDGTVVTDALIRLADDDADRDSLIRKLE